MAHLPELHWTQVTAFRTVAIMTMHASESGFRAPRVPAADNTDDDTVLADAVSIAERVGARLLARFEPSPRLGAGEAILAALQANDDAATPLLREALLALRPAAGWYDDEEALSSSRTEECWVVDAVEGNINHVHGTEEWGVSITLLRHGSPVLAVVRQPTRDLTWTAIRGGGARSNGERLHVSAKAELRLALAATGQAEVDQVETYQRIGDSITAMLHHALLVRATVPSTFPMLLVAAGRNDVFWQYRPTLPGVAAGTLFVTEAGGSITAIDGTAWTQESPGILATSPHLRAPAIAALAAVA